MGRKPLAAVKLLWDLEKSFFAKVEKHSECSLFQV